MEVNETAISKILKKVGCVIPRGITDWTADLIYSGTKHQRSARCRLSNHTAADWMQPVSYEGIVLAPGSGNAALF